MKGNVVTILTNIGSPVRFERNKIDLLNSDGLWFAAAKYEHVRIYTLATQFLEQRVSRDYTFNVVIGVILTRSLVFCPVSNGR